MITAVVGTGPAGPARTGNRVSVGLSSSVVPSAPGAPLSHNGYVRVSVVGSMFVGQGVAAETGGCVIASEPTRTATVSSAALMFMRLADECGDVVMEQLQIRLMRIHHMARGVVVHLNVLLQRRLNRQ